MPSLHAPRLIFQRTLLLRGLRPPYPDPEPVHSYPLRPLIITSTIIHTVSRPLANYVYMHRVRFNQLLVAVQVAYEGRRHSFEHDGHLLELGDESVPPARKTTSATEKI